MCRMKSVTAPQGKQRIFTPQNLMWLRESPPGHFPFPGTAASNSRETHTSSYLDSSAPARKFPRDPGGPRSEPPASSWPLPWPRFTCAALPLNEAKWLNAAKLGLASKTASQLLSSPMGKESATPSVFLTIESSNVASLLLGTPTPRGPCQDCLRDCCHVRFKGL